jgi:23S rRNA maturation-related 3'-5' exoribonuclease YhaM
MKKKFMDEIKEILTAKEFKAVSKWLNDNAFFTSPASSRFHLSCEGGLLEHSLNVWNCLKKFNYDQNLGYSNRTVGIVALFHDLCKAGTYTKKVLKNGEEGKGYIVSDNFPFGHGEKSALILTRLGIDMSDEEILAIRYHMGASEGKQVYDVQRKYPLAFWLHTSDMLASMNESKEVE